MNNEIVQTEAEQHEEARQQENYAASTLDQMLASEALKDATIFIVSPVSCTATPRVACGFNLVAGNKYHFLIEGAVIYGAENEDVDGDELEDATRALREAYLKVMRKRPDATVILSEDIFQTALEIRHRWKNARSASFVRDVLTGTAKAGKDAVYERVLHDGTVGRLGPDGANFIPPEVV